MKEAFKSAPIAFIMKPIKVKEFEDILYMLQKLTKHNALLFSYENWSIEYQCVIFCILKAIFVK